MVIDSSALAAILFLEPEADRISKAIEADTVRLVSSACHLELGIVVESRKGPAGGREFDLLLHRSRIEIVSLTAELSELARDAWRRYGKGQNPAGLNLCDCCSYALAKQTGEKLLFKGGDFSQTDVETVEW